MQTSIKVMGIDLAGLEKNITGICVLVPNHEPILYSVRRNEEIEVYPHATKIALHEKEGGEELLKELVERAPVKNEHEHDAILCAITAKFYYEGRYRAFGKVDKIIVPVITQYPVDIE